MRKILSCTFCAVVLSAAGTSWGALGVVVDEDFESYADTSAMSAVWVGTNGVLVDEIDDDRDLVPEVSGIGNFAFHPGGSVNELILAIPVVATADEWIQLTVDIYDNATDLDPFFPLNPGNKRMSLGMRGHDGVAAENIIELGMYSAEWGKRFAYRGILFDSIYGTLNPNWDGWDLGTEAFDIDGSGVIEPDEQDVPINRYHGGAWYTYRATIKPESVLYEFDFDYDGTFDAGIEHIDMALTEAGFDGLRFGGPSGITSAGGGATFDNIKLEVIAAEPCCIPCDLDGDGFVGLNDLDIILGNWNLTVPPADPRADTSGDGYVGLEDLDCLLFNWNAGTPPNVTVPEPAMMAMMALSGLALVGRGRPCRS